MNTWTTRVARGVAGAVLAVAGFAGAAETVVEVAGVKYEPSVTLAGQRLALNGAGVRYKAIFKVYTAGLYLPVRAETPEAALTAKGAKRIQIVMLRDIDGNELGKLFTRGIEDNMNRDEFAKVVPGVLRMGEIFATRRKLSAGESFSVDFVPGTGVVVLVNGKPVADPIREPEFFEAMLRIWLGKSPADRLLKDALLGKAPATPNS